MDDKQTQPIKNLDKKDFSKNKIFFLESFKPINIHQDSSHFRECNKRYFPNNIEQKDEVKKPKHKHININSIKNTNFFRLNSASKNKIYLSQEKENKNKKIHKENLKKMKDLQKILDDLEKNNNSLQNVLDNLNNEENKLTSDLQKKDDEEKGLENELNNLKSVNEEKNREYLRLQQQQMNQENTNNNNSLNNNRHRRHNPNIENENASENDLLNRLLRLNNQAMGNNIIEQEGGENNNIDLSLNDSNYDQIQLLNEDLGPPMTLEQIQALPNDRYPKKETYDEKCFLCGFNLCYNDSIIKISHCQHIFHKECLSNFLINRQASKCPVCKVSLI